MKNKKLLKAIAATIVCSSMALTAFSFAACGGNNEGEGGEGGGAHQHRYTWVDDENYVTHHRHCTVDGCDDPDKAPEDHTWSGEECTKCHAIQMKEEDRAIVPEYKGAADGPVAGEQKFTSRFLADNEKTEALAEDYDNGVVSIPAKTVIRGTGDKSGKYKTSVQNGTISIKVPVAGKLTIYYSSGSSGGGAKYTLSMPGGSDTQTITAGTNELQTLEVDVVPGTYIFSKANGTVNTYEIVLEYSNVSSPIKEIAISNPGTTDYLVTQKVDCTGVTIIAKDEAGATYPVNLENCKFDTVKYIPGRSGEYEIGVTYYLSSNLDSAKKEFSATYKVKVYMVDSIELSTIGLVSNKQVTVQQAYLPNETFKKDNLNVIATCNLGGNTIQQKLKKDWYSVSTPTLTAEGTQTVTVSVDNKYTTGNKTVSASYEVAVKAKKDVVENKVEITVGETGEFKTLTQAVQYLKACNYEASVNKVIKLQAGTYTEKVWLDVPNVTLIGLGDDIDDTVISYSLVEGDIDDVTGVVWGLSCATLHVTGNNFKAYNLAIRNDFDYINNSGNYSGSQAAQGVALTIEGDGNVLYNCHLYGNQDTLYMKSGRTYFKDSQIDGNIDFIFGGEKGLAYFEECDIVAIDREQKEKEDPQNGYVTAPQHKEATKPDYGYIFYKCNVTDDGNVNAGAMALGRPWGPNATVAYIECQFSAAYSTEASDGSHKIHRWNDMSGNLPENADYKEYGSTGAGAITETVKGGTVIDATAAASFTKANIFGTSNGKSGYTVEFKCDDEYANLRILAGLDQGQIVENPVETYRFDEVEKNSSETVQDHFAGKLEWEGAGSWNGNSIYVSNNTIITVAKPGKVSIDWYSGYGTNADAEISYDAEGKATIKVITAGRYIVSITVNGEDIPAQSVDRTLSVYVIDGEGDPTLLTTITKPDGNCITEANLVSLITADNYPGKLLDKVYLSDKTTEYDYSAITADTDLYLTLKDASKTWQIGETINLAIASGATPAIGGVTFAGDYSGHGSELKTNVGTTITIDIAAGAHVSIEWYPSDNGQYGADGNATVDYSVAGKATITIKLPAEGESGGSNGNIYIRSITIVE